eukprot:CAMPEP_0195519086 /NCGR_PEP_ID=MMETSP0794_2-20130614/14359_1 /TAXON_ID=515487 /ORGANISM="Stephanopyxis turris, Strain CCMP 815" /LENGTH=565 /DNA_ID=CAMNT_0040648189 /DNA_START=96 /DNA_END=1793 /DNA_ORIENTATION=+
MLAMLVSPALTTSAVPEGAPSVKLTNGDVWGRALPASGGVPVNEFLGIPFGHPTKRWEAPEDWVEDLPESPFNATMWGRACLQVLTDTTYYGTEDCLKLNVWQPAPAQEGDDLKPVMVYIYGGSDQFGEAEPYNMSGLAAFHDVVAVNMNYRTGPIGWMAFQADVDAKQSTGNFGIMDIQAALRWVQREIQNFGGDPTRVAIHGQSSGAGLAEVTGIVSPASNGLLRGVISESGGLGAKSLASGLANTEHVAKSAGCYNDTTTPEEVKACMVALPPLTVTKMTNTGSWGPTVDGITVPDDPGRMLSEGRVIPSLEAVAFGAQTLDSFLNLKDQYVQKDGNLEQMSNDTYIAYLKSKFGAKFDEALKLYPPAAYPAGQPGSIKNVQNIGQIASDPSHCGNRQRAATLTAKTNATGYVYRFDYFYQSNTKCNSVPNFHNPEYGPLHQDEVTFVMGQPNFMELGSCCGKWGLSEGEESCAQEPQCTNCFDPELGEGYHAYFDDKEWNLTRAVGDFWTSFARSGSSGDESKWPSTDTSGKGGIVFNADLPGGSAVETDLYSDAAYCSFW